MISQMIFGSQNIQPFQQILEFGFLEHRQLNLASTKRLTRSPRGLGKFKHLQSTI
ncbi:MAG: hypothetical protein R3B41_01405 [Candidatus Doudnabacteria bacterium]